MPTYEELYKVKDESKVKRIGDGSVTDWFKNLGGVGKYHNIDKGKTPKRGEE